MKNDMTKRIVDFSMFLSNIIKHGNCFGCLYGEYGLLHEAVDIGDMSPIITIKLKPEECNGIIYLTNTDEIRFPECCTDLPNVKGIMLLSLDFGSYVKVDFDYTRPMLANSQIIILEKELKLYLMKM